MAVLRKARRFPGDSHFTTWAYKFALLEAGVKVRRRAWQGREVPLEPESWELIPGLGSTPHRGRRTETECSRALREAIDTELSRTSGRCSSP